MFSLEKFSGSSFEHSNEIFDASPLPLQRSVIFTTWQTFCFKLINIIEKKNIQN